MTLGRWESFTRTILSRLRCVACSVVSLTPPTPPPRRDPDKVLMDHANDAKVTEGSVYHLSG